MPENARIAATIYYSHYIPCSLLCLHGSIVLYFEKPGVLERMGDGGFPNQVLLEFPFSFDLENFAEFYDFEA